MLLFVCEVMVNVQQYVYTKGSLILIELLRSLSFMLILFLFLLLLPCKLESVFLRKKRCKLCWKKLRKNLCSLNELLFFMSSSHLSLLLLFVVSTQQQCWSLSCEVQRGKVLSETTGRAVSLQRLCFWNFGFGKIPPRSVQHRLAQVRLLQDSPCVCAPLLPVWLCYSTGIGTGYR